MIAAAGTAAILKLVDLGIGLRVSEEEEAIGLDLTQHGELAYAHEVALDLSIDSAEASGAALGSMAQPQALSEAGD